MCTVSWKSERVKSCSVGTQSIAPKILDMKAARFYGKGDFRVEEVPEPVPKDGEVLVDVEWCGICGKRCAASSFNTLHDVQTI